MEPVTDPPPGYQEPYTYELPFRAKIATAAILFPPFVAILYLSDPAWPPFSSSLTWIIAGTFGIIGSLFSHESLHYIASVARGNDPEYVWPNRVKFGSDILYTETTVVSLLAPQVLSPVYLLPILYGVPPSLELMLWFAFGINLFGGLHDLPWAVRRLTWPAGTIVIQDEDGETNHVAHPKQ